MSAKLKLWFVNHKNLVKVFAFTLLSLVLLVVAWLIDCRFPDWKSHMPELLLLPADVSLSLLSNLSAVFLTISIFLLTTIITIVNHYTSRFTPRLTQDFIDKADVLTLLGIFVGGFFYTIIALFMLQNTDDTNAVISGSIGIIYSIASMLGFVFFAQRVLHYLKTSDVIELIYQEGETLVAKETALRLKSERYEKDLIADSLEVTALETGYLFSVDFNDIFRILNETQCELVVTQKIGQYTPKGATVAKLNLLQAKDENTGKLLEKLSRCFIINVYKNEEVDYHHEIIKLTEMALMALSPGFNDPNTAIICINKISMLLGQLFSSGNQFIVVEENDKCKVIYQNYSVEEELYLVFSQIISYSNQDPLVSKEILEGIFLIYMLAGISAKDQVKAYFDVAYELLSANFQHEIHRQSLKEVKDHIEREHSYLKEISCPINARPWF